MFIPLRLQASFTANRMWRRRIRQIGVRRRPIEFSYRTNGRLIMEVVAAIANRPRARAPPNTTPSSRRPNERSKTPIPPPACNHRSAASAVASPAQATRKPKAQKTTKSNTACSMNISSTRRKRIQTPHLPSNLRTSYPPTPLSLSTLAKKRCLPRSSSKTRSTSPPNNPWPQ